MSEPTPLERVLDGQSESLADLQRRVDTLERLVQTQRKEMADVLREVLEDLRDDTDFSRPLWAQGIEHTINHLATDEGKKKLDSHGFKELVHKWTGHQIQWGLNNAGRMLLVILVIASLSGLMLWVGSTGLWIKAAGLKP